MAVVVPQNHLGLVLVIFHFANWLMELLAYLSRVIVFGSDKVFAKIAWLHLENYGVNYISIWMEIFGFNFESHLLLLMKLYTLRQRMLNDFTLRELLPRNNPESNIKSGSARHLLLFFTHIFQKLLIVLLFPLLARLLPNHSKEHII